MRRCTPIEISSRRNRDLDPRGSRPCVEEEEPRHVGTRKKLEDEHEAMEGDGDDERCTCAGMEKQAIGGTKVSAGEKRGRAAGGKRSSARGRAQSRDKSTTVRRVMRTRKAVLWLEKVNDGDHVGGTRSASDIEEACELGLTKHPRFIQCVRA